MAADLHIHIYEGLEERDLMVFFSDTPGSKWSSYTQSIKKSWDAYKKIGNTPNIWIGEASWLKASLFEDAKSYIPDTVQAIDDLIGEDLPVIDDALIAKIVAAFGLPNFTSYSLANPDEVRKFLEAHKGKQVFTVSW